MTDNPYQQIKVRPTIEVPYLPLVRYRLTFRALDQLVIPPFAGALWRSVLGPALRAQSEELYCYFFETKPPENDTRMKNYPSAPHPFVFDIAADAPSKYKPGDELSIDFTLVGRANDSADIAIDALATAGMKGLGKSRGRAGLQKVESIWHAELPETRLVGTGPDALELPEAISPPLPPIPPRIVVQLDSPLRVMHKNRLIQPRYFRPGDMLRPLIRRVSQLMHFHTEHDLDTDFKRLTSLAGSVRMLDDDLGFMDQKRWSSAKGREIPMGGIVGGFVLDMHGIEALWPYLWLGQWVHTGKGTVMGLGAIRIRMI